MKKMMLITTLVLSLCLSSTTAFANPSLLPQHPGYPMGEFKDPVMGVPTANDPGEKAPLPAEALPQASEFHDAHAIDPDKENRPNIVHGDKQKGGDS